MEKKSDNPFIVVMVFLFAITFYFIVGFKNFLLKGVINFNLADEQQKLIRELIDNLQIKRDNFMGDDRGLDEKVITTRKNCIDQNIPLFKVWLVELI